MKLFIFLGVVLLSLTLISADQAIAQGMLDSYEAQAEALRQAIRDTDDPNLRAEYRKELRETEATIRSLNSNAAGFGSGSGFTPGRDMINEELNRQMQNLNAIIQQKGQQQQSSGSGWCRNLGPGQACAAK